MTHQNSFAKWFLIGTPSTVLTTVAVLMFNNRNLSIALGAGIISGAVTMVTMMIFNYRQNKRIKELQEKALTRQEYEQIKVELEQLLSEVEKKRAMRDRLKVDLEERNEEIREKSQRLSQLEGQFFEVQGRYDEIKQDISSLSERKEELERRVVAIQRQNPELAQLEQLQKAIEQARLEKSGLEGQINTLTHQVDSLENQRKTLVSVEAQLAMKQAQLEQLLPQVESITSRIKELEQKEAEIEILRVMYDALFSEKKTFEDRLNQLRPEVEGLELQKQQILQAIREAEQEYLRAEHLRDTLRKLELEIRENQVQIRRGQREVEHLQSIITEQEEEKINLQQEEENLRRRIKELKEEVNTIENSAESALKSITNPLWINLPVTPRDIDTGKAGEQTFLDQFEKYLISEGFAFPRRVIRAFHTSLKVQDISALVVLAGISGTGKSELPQKYANFAGASMLTLAVQPRWDSPQDLQGFYNYIEKKYKPTDLMRGLWQYKSDSKMQDRIVIVLLDEMNLARVEYYFSDFLSKLETRRSQATYLELEIGSLALSEDQRKIPIPKQFLFVGTMNEDETTQSLSDKVLDRANVLTFGKPKALKLREEVQHSNPQSSLPQGYIPYSQFEKWIRTPQSNSLVVEKVQEYVNQANHIMERLGHPFAHRVYQAITRYVVNYPGVSDTESPEFRAALADQFGQKLLPKLRGVMVEESHEELEQMFRLINELGDPALIKAFENATDKNRGYGQFQWRGMVYEDDDSK